MNSKRLALSVLVGGAGLGIISLASPSVRDFVDGLLGIPRESAASTTDGTDLRADLAAPALRTPLQPEELDELLEGFAYLSKAQYDNALPIIGKYALLGDDMAQYAVGGMYSFGQGLPLDREEGLGWLALAAAQRNRGAAELAATINTTPDWNQRVAAVSAAGQAPSELGRSDGASGLAYSDNRVPAYALSTAARRSSALGDSAATVAGSSSAPVGARSSIEEAYGAQPANRRYSGAQVGLPLMENTSPIILNRAGPGTYSDGSGDMYTQAGPHGVVNTRTGEFSPTN